MGVPNYLTYTVTEHAQDRILTRFNIPKKDIDGWMSRLMSQGVYDETQDNGRKKYHWHDIVFILDPKTKSVVTVYSRNANELELSQNQVNPEVQSVVNDALKHYKNSKRVSTAKKIYNDLKQMFLADQKMIKPGTNYRHSNKSWDILLENFYRIEKEIDTATMLMKEADTYKRRGKS